MAETAIEKKYLTGLKFKGSKKVKGEDGTSHVPTERALTPADVLDWLDKGATVIVVTADGRKHTVNKKAADNAKPEE